MQRCFQRALIRPRVRCFGLTLQPLTIGHLFLLCDIESPFVLEVGRDIDVTDLALAAFVCSQPHDESRRDMQRWWFRWFAWFHGFMVRKKDAAKEYDAMIDYLHDAMESPKVKRTTPIGIADVSPSDPSVIPLHWQLLSILMSDFGMSKRTAMGTTVKEAQLLWLAKVDRERGVEWWTESDDAFTNWCREQDAAGAMN